MTKLWSDYDTKATGLIDPQDVAVLVFELDGPLGRADEYQDIHRNIVEEQETDKDSGAVLKKD